MSNTTNIEQKIQENEKLINALEAKHGLAGSNAISAEEYGVIASTMQRLECGGLITSADYFDTFSSVVFKKFFRTQPEAIRILAEAAQNGTASQRDNINLFVEELGRVNAILCELVENNRFFEDLTVFLSELERARAVEHYQK